MKPKITVIIPTYNRSQYLRECLESILNQTLKPHQVIVVNNGSTDDTQKICLSYKNRIEYFEVKQTGKSFALNLGLQKSTGDYIWIFDDDDVALPDALERLVEPLEENPEYGFSYSTFYFTEADAEGRLNKIISELIIPDLNKRGFLIPLLEWNFLGGAALFARKSCYEDVGGFSPELIRSQDYEMAIRIARKFKGIRVEGKPTFHYRQHSGVRASGSFMFHFSERNQKWLEYDQIFFRKVYKSFELSEYLPPREDLSKKFRQAILQRLAIMSYKCLIREVVQDLRYLARLKDDSPISEEEYMIIRQIMISFHRHNISTTYDCMEFFEEIGELAKTSRIIRMLRPKVVRAILARFRSNPRHRDLSGIVARLRRLYVPSLIPSNQPRRTLRSALKKMMYFLGAIVLLTAEVLLVINGIESIAAWGTLILSAMFLILLVIVEATVSLQNKIAESKNEIHLQITNHYDQTEALLSIFSTLSPQRPLPKTRGWASSPDYLKLISEHIFKHKPQFIVELGSGLSTLICAYTLKQSGSVAQVVSFDHNEEYARLTNESLRLHNLHTIAKAVHAPLTDVMVNGKRWIWYDINESEITMPIDLLIVDGPPGMTQKLARYPALPELSKFFSDRATLILDDAKRPDERTIAKLWAEEFDRFNVEYLPLEKGALVVRPRLHEDIQVEESAFVPSQKMRELIEKHSRVS